MDNTADDIAPQELAALSYDDNVAYEEQLPTEAERAAADAASLANRIGRGKVYLLSESSATARTTKRRHDDDGGDVKMDEDEDMDDMDPSFRGNAILFNGQPIANLPTARLFAYATHFDAHPMGLEWVDDQTCVFVFPSKKDARDAFTRLTKPTPSTAEPAVEAVPMSLDDPADSSFVHAKPFPIALWPPEDRINQTLGKGQGLKGPIRMRWARLDDVKKKGAKRESQFYRKHGTAAGKELFNGRELPPPPAGKRKRESAAEDDERRRRELDDELDNFLAEDDRQTTPDDAEGRNDGDRTRKRAKRRSRSRSASRTPSDRSSPVPASPPSKMRSDYISNDGRTLLERTSLLRAHPSISSDPLDDRRDLASRLTAPMPRRARRRGGRDGELDGERGGRDRPQLQDRLRSPDLGGSEDGSRTKRRRGGRAVREREREVAVNGHGRKPRGERIVERPHKTQQELDDELDAFLNGQD